MKTATINAYHMPELDARIQRKLETVDREITHDAENNGVRNKPPLLENDIKPYFAEHHHKTQALLGETAAELQPAVLISEVVESEKNTERKVRELRNKLAAIKEKGGNCEAGVKGGQREYSKLRMPLAWLAVCIPLLGDGLLNLPAFETYGYNFVEALCVSILLAASLAILAHTFDRIVGLGKKVWQKRAIATSILAILTCLFFYLANARAQYLSNEASTNGTSIHFSTIPLALFSVVLFVVAVAVNRFFFPTAEQRKAMRQFDEQVRMQQAIKDERAQIEAQIETVTLQHEELVQTNGSIYVYGGKLEDMIISNAHIGFAKWKRISMMHRSDNGRPIGFNDNDYPFTFQRHFQGIKSFLI